MKLDEARAILVRNASASADYARRAFDRLLEYINGEEPDVVDLPPLFEPAQDLWSLDFHVGQVEALMLAIYAIDEQMNDDEEVFAEEQAALGELRWLCHELVQAEENLREGIGDQTMAKRRFDTALERARAEVGE